MRSGPGGGSTVAGQRYGTRLLIAGAALLAGAFGQTARAQGPVGAPAIEGGEVAFATPRMTGGSGWNGLGLPQPLDPATAQRIRRIFALQAAGEIPEAASLTAQLEDHTLLGDILADRYLREIARQEAGDGLAAGPVIPTLTTALAAWLRAYPDLPDARAIHAALLARLPDGQTPPVPDLRLLDPDQGPGQTVPGSKTSAVGTAPPVLDRAVRACLGTGLRGAERALRLIARARGLATLAASQLRAQVAFDLFTQGLDGPAARLGMQAYHDSDGQIGLGAFAAGLAAWRDADPQAALIAFEAAARAASIPADLRAGAALWAARANLRLGNVAGYRPWLECAATQPQTFYGLLAIRMLGRPLAPVIGTRTSDFGATDAAAATPGMTDAVPATVSETVWPTTGLAGALDALLGPGRLQLLSGLVRLPAPVASVPTATATIETATLSEIDIETVMATASGRHALALLQVGQTERAETALRGMWARVDDDPGLRRSIMLVARAGGLDALADQAASLLGAADPAAEPRAAPRLHPAHGFRTDPALVYALARLESNFNANAVSGAGAHGMMQLMPVTADYITGRPDHFAAVPGRLHDAGLNLDLGQRYVSYLAHAGTVDGSLIKLLASYNAGPNAMQAWGDRAGFENDPLMFIEAIPIDETRNFVRRSLGYLWIYAARMGLPTPSLDALARGDWPDYAEESELSDQSSRLATVH